MNKPDSTGESLESILASIRRSLSEQSTGVLEDEPAVPATLLPPETGAADDMDVPRLFGGTGAAPLDAPADERARLEDDPPPPPLSTLTPALDEPPPPAPAAMAPSADLEDPPPPAPAAVAVAPPPGQAPKDPFWFLSGRGEGERKDGAAPASAGKVPVPEPKPVRTEIVRGPLPPFFGSSAEAAKMDAGPVPGISTGAGTVPPGPAPAAAATARAYDGGLPKGASAEVLRTPAWPPDPSVPPGPSASPLPASPAPIVSAPLLTPPAAREGLLNGKASLLSPPPAAPITSPAPGGGAEASPHVRGLEAMVAELLRPMLRRWLDENMPRLVSAALKAEADLMSTRDPKKS